MKLAINNIQTDNSNVIEENRINFKKELLIDIDIFKKPIELEGLNALAQVIQNLIIIEPGTYPNQPELGVGISNYLFEFLDDLTARDLKNNIDNQIARFINFGDAEITSEIKVSNSNGKTNTLLITIVIENLNAQFSLNDENRYLGFNLLFGVNNNTNKLVSKIVL